MIIDYTQNKDGVDISFINEKNQIEIITAPLIHGYYKYVRAESFDNNIIPNLRSFKNKDYIKKETTKYFSNHNINEFLNYEIKNEHPLINEKISKLLMPNPFSVDIETEINMEFGYSTAEKAENKVLSISITDVSLNTIYFELNNPNRIKKINENDLESIKNMVLTSLGKHSEKYEYNFSVRTFESEIEMLNVFLECINKYFHSIIGWNFVTFDWVYIFNRCKRLGIEIKKASPIFKIFEKTIKINKETSLKISMPAHRIIVDYMQLFKDSLIYNSMDSYALTNIAETILGLNKIMYEGNLSTLYKDPNKFIAYALIDTILVMLIHKTTNLYNVDFFESYFNGIAYNKISQNSISEALIYNELRQENIFFLESEFNNTTKRPFQGGYVKTPTKKIINLGLGVDFSGLYPNSIITNGISPERKIDFILMDKDLGRPINEKEEKKWLEYKSQGFTLTPRGQIYDNRTDGVFTRIEKKLIAQRKVFKGHAENIYLEIIPKLEQLINNKQ